MRTALEEMPNVLASPLPAGNVVDMLVAAPFEFEPGFPHQGSPALIDRWRELGILRDALRTCANPDTLLAALELTDVFSTFRRTVLANPATPRTEHVRELTTAENPAALAAEFSVLYNRYARAGEYDAEKHVDLLAAVTRDLPTLLKAMRQDTDYLVASHWTLRNERSAADFFAPLPDVKAQLTTAGVLPTARPHVWWWEPNREEWLADFSAIKCGQPDAHDYEALLVTLAEALWAGLGDDAAAWRLALDLAGNWEGSVSELIETARAAA